MIGILCVPPAMITNLCLVLTFNVFDKMYQRCCRLPHVVVDGCCHKVNGVEAKEHELSVVGSKTASRSREATATGSKE